MESQMIASYRKKFLWKLPLVRCETLIMHVTRGQFLWPFISTIMKANFWYHF